MARIRCKSCGRSYSYQGDCCPHCGAFNRRPSREYIGADGAIHYADEKVCFEEQICYEDQAEKAWKDSPDRMPARKSRVKRPNTAKFSSGDVNATIDRFTRSASESAKLFASQFFGDDDEETTDNTASFRRKKPSGSFREMASDYVGHFRGRSTANTANKKGVGAAVALGISILIALSGLVMNIAEDIDIFEPQREPAYPEDIATAPAIPDNLHYYDYGGIFRLNDGREFTAFTNQMTVDGSGTVNVSVYCDGLGEGVWPVLVDEWTMTEYEPNVSTEWQENNYDLTFYTGTHDPNEYWYTLYYRDTFTGERYHIAEINSTGYMSADPNAIRNGVFRDIPLLDGETLYTTVLMEHEDGLLTAMVLCDYDDLHARFIRYLQDESNGDLYEPIDFLDNGVGEYWYTFDIGTANFDREFTFVYYDADYDTMLNVAACEVLAGGDVAAVEHKATALGNFQVDGTMVNYAGHLETADDTVTAVITHDGDPTALGLQPVIIGYATANRYDAITDISLAPDQYEYFFRLAEDDLREGFALCYFSTVSFDTYELIEFIP